MRTRTLQRNNDLYCHQYNRITIFVSHMYQARLASLCRQAASVSQIYDNLDDFTARYVFLDLAKHALPPVTRIDVSNQIQRE